MPYTSPFLNPGQYVNNVNGLSKDAITADEWVASTVRQAKDFSDKHSSNFALIAEPKGSLEQFEPRWAKALQDSRDAASSLVGWLTRYDQVFLAMINDVESPGDAQDAVLEFNNFRQFRHPTDKYQLDGTPGPKKAFNEIEQAVDTETNHVIEVMQDSKDWQKAIAELKQKLPQVQSGVRQVAGASKNYATKLE